MSAPTAPPAASPANAASTAAAAGRRMSTWRLEWLRLIRTPRALSVAAVFVFLGLVEPLATKYQQQLINRVAHGVQIKVPAPTPAAGIASYANDATQIGLIVVVVIAAGAFTFDARRGLAIFLRTRAAGMWQLIAPRFAMNAAAGAAGYVLGTLAAWYETSLLIGAPAAAGMADGILCGVIYLAFAVAVAAAAASIARGMLGSIGIALATLLVLPVAGTVRAVHAWLPSTLAGAPAELLAGSRLSDFARPLGTAVAAAAVLLAFAVARLRHREV